MIAKLAIAALKAARRLDEAGLECFLAATARWCVTDGLDCCCFSNYDNAARPRLPRHLPRPAVGAVGAVGGERASRRSDLGNARPQHIQSAARALEVRMLEFSLPPRDVRVRAPLAALLPVSALAMSEFHGKLCAQAGIPSGRDQALHLVPAARRPRRTNRSARVKIAFTVRSAGRPEGVSRLHDLLAQQVAENAVRPIRKMYRRRPPPVEMAAQI